MAWKGKEQLTWKIDNFAASQNLPFHYRQSNLPPHKKWPIWSRSSPLENCGKNNFWRISLLTWRERVSNICAPLAVRSSITLSAAMTVIWGNGTFVNRRGRRKGLEEKKKKNSIYVSLPFCFRPKPFLLLNTINERSSIKKRVLIASWSIFFLLLIQISWKSPISYFFI